MGAAGKPAAPGPDASAAEDAEAGDPSSRSARRLALLYLRDLVGHGAPARHETGQAAAARGAIRGLLLNPWFAAGCGFVLAATMFLVAPHTDLSFPNGKAQQSQCREAGCPGAGSAPGQAAGQPGRQIAEAGQPARKAAGTKQGNGRAAGSGPGAAAKPTITFAVVWQQQDYFLVQITIGGSASLASWRLRFVLRDTQITQVTGAAWQPTSAGDGGTASALSPLAGLGSPGWNFGYQIGRMAGLQERGAASDAATAADTITFTVYGTGTPHLPKRCFFDGARCTFTAA